MAISKESMHNNPEQPEQVLYISPEENITEIRERLGRTHAHDVALVFPPQTRLRSHVAWRLLRQRAQELGKDISIVSSDQHIRAIARSVQFKTASSL
ncbi:MAG: hypothetical protein ACR2H5_22265 [Ktedonobacteraceae bacterium]